MTKRNLALAVALAALGAAWTAPAAAQESTADAEMDQANLGETVVTAARQDGKGTMAGGLLSKKAHMGIMGDVDVLDIPYSMQSMTTKAIETYSDPSQPLANVLANNPSIRSSTSSPMYTDFSMRGINMNGNHFMLNGVPSLFYQFTTPPAHIIERMDITSGPNAAVNGVSMSNNGTNSGATPAPGTINVITKRATKTPITKYTQVFSGRSTAGEYIDIGRRFGKNDAWGVRVNAEMLKGGLALPGAKIDSKDVFVNIDHRDARSMTNLFFGYWDHNIDGAQRWFTYSGNGRALPSAPDAKTSYDFPETWKRMYVKVLTLNHEQKINDRWKAFFNMGYSFRDGTKMNSGANLQFDANGNFTNVNKANAQNESGKNFYLQLGVAGKVQTGAVEHNLAFSVDRSRAQYWNATKNGLGGNYGGNLYSGIVFRPGFYPLPAMPNQKQAWNETNVGITLMDTMSFGKWNVLLAATHKREYIEVYTDKKTTRNNNILPTWGLTYKPTANTAVYYGHTESFSRGYVTPDSYVNKGELFAPVRSKQNEIGVKYANKGLLTTFALFEIDEPNRYDRTIGTQKWKIADGKNIYRGAELTVNGRIAPRLTATGGLLYLDAVRDKTDRGKKDGFFVNGAAKWSGVLGLDYALTDQINLIGRLNWMGKAYIDSNSPAGRTAIPGYTTLDLGMKYRTKLNDMPLDLSLMCYNATNRSYWMGRGGSTTFGLSMPRTLMFSATLSM